MKVEVEIISKELVKPSSPTPNHLRHYNLSLLDHLTPQLNNSMVYFFAANNVSDQFINASHHLKKSLSKALTHYYPLAGRLVDKAFIECNDEGALYLEARVRCNLNDLVDSPIPSEVSKLLPFGMDDIVDTPLGVQLDIFDCGGIAIGACMSHKIADAMSYFVFIQRWAAIARGESCDHDTHFISATLFPPRDMQWYDPNRTITKQKIVSKVLVFDASAIDGLKAKYAKRMDLQKPPSRVEALSTFIWTRFMASTQVAASESPRFYVVAHTVNLRSRMDPPLPAYAFGNYYRAVKEFPSLDDEGECYELVKKLREEIRKIDSDYILKLQEGSEYLNSLRDDLRKFETIKGEIVPFTFTALCRFPVYDADFRWGKPIWVCPPAWKVKNVAVFMDTKLGGGIEAHISMTEEDMVRFQNDRELLVHSSTKVKLMGVQI
ncbi:Vinorine synthase [Spatholobus suberectus]|nr:Vinorine synthase [Spatholobus suberectus]